MMAFADELTHDSALNNEEHTYFRSIITYAYNDSIVFWWKWNDSPQPHIRYGCLCYVNTKCTYYWKFELCCSAVHRDIRLRLWAKNMK